MTRGHGWRRRPGADRGGPHPEEARGPGTEDLVGNADEPIRVLRLANRVPLLYQQAACAITKAVIQTNWKSYGLGQPRGALPVGPCAV